MQAQPAPNGYTRLQIRLHWAVMVLILLQYLLHEGIAATFDEGLDTGAMVLTGPAIGHMVGGALVFLLMAWRLMLRNERGAPEPPESDPEWQKRAARTTHLLFYVLVLSMPFSGGLAWGMASPAFSTIHEVTRAVLLLLILLHIAGALYGQFVQKTNILNRMRVASD
ncbi:MAG: cytochrome b/b6 domain-containing protein [Pseudomonadota bacterium]